MIVNVSRILICLLLLCGFSFAHAAQPASVFLEDLTWTELKEQVAGGKTTILVPIGGTEQSGPYMALGKHNVRARLLAQRIAEKLGNAVVAPVVAYVPEGAINPPTSHMRFPGTITVTDAVFEQMLESAAQGFKLHGFHDVVFLGDHGGYQADLKVVADRLNHTWGSSAHAHALPEYYRSTQEDYVQYLKSRGFAQSEIGTHAGLADTSLMLALDPQLVRSDALPHAAKPGPEQGVYGGDPRRASAELGQPGVEFIVERTVAAIKKATAR